VGLFSRFVDARFSAKRSGRLFGIAEWPASFGNLQMLTAIALAAAPGFVRAPTYRHSQPMAPGDLAIVIFGCTAIIIFGVIVMLIWNRTGGRR
jgi:hypothetical protein